MQIQGEAFGRFACVLSSIKDPPDSMRTPATRIRDSWNESPRCLVQRAPGPSNDRHRLVSHPLADLGHTGRFRAFRGGRRLLLPPQDQRSSRLAWTAPSMSTPTGGLDPLAALRRFLGSRAGYLVAFVVFMLALDAVFLLRTLAREWATHASAVDFWLIFVPLIGLLAYLRFDMMPQCSLAERCCSTAQAMDHRSPHRFGRRHQTLAGAAHWCFHVLPIRQATCWRCVRRRGLRPRRNQPDLRWLVTTDFATDLAVRSRAADRIDLGNALDAGAGW